MTIKSDQNKSDKRRTKSVQVFTFARIKTLKNNAVSAIIKVRPTVLEYCTMAVLLLKPNCGLKGAAILHNWVPSCIPRLWVAGSGCPFLYCLTSFGLGTMLLLEPATHAHQVEKLNN